jgi:hypothetical protein
MGIFRKLIDFLYVEVEAEPLPLSESDRFHKRFNTPTFEVKLENGDTGWTADWSRGGLRVVKLVKQYGDDQDIKGRLLARDKYVGRFVGKTVGEKDFKQGLKIKFIEVDKNTQHYLDEFMRTQKF